MKTATPQDTCDHMMGAGALSFSWWRYATVAGVGAAGDVLGDGWTATVRCEDPDDGRKSVTRQFGHADVIKAARKVVKAGRPGIPGTTREMFDQCKHLVFSADYADFDACTSDELLQVIVLGKVAFG